VFCPKYRRKVLVPPIDARLKEIVHSMCAEMRLKLVEVAAAYTSQTCAECGSIDRANRQDQATFVCVSCGHADNADTNAARNIHQARALAVESPKRTLRSVGKRKQQVGAIHACV
jgi:transposase